MLIHLINSLMNNVDHINSLFSDYFGNKIKPKDAAKVKQQRKEDIFNRLTDIINPNNQRDVRKSNDKCSLGNYGA
jgi:hypothetical protein